MKQIGLALGLGCAVLIACGSKDPETNNTGAGGNSSASGAAGKGGSSAAAGKGGSSAAAGKSGSSAAGNGGPGDAVGVGSASDAGSAQDAGSPADPGNPQDGGGAGQCQAGFLPMAVGNSWTYRVTDPVDGVSMKTQTIDAEQRVGGTGPHADETAFHAVTSKMSGNGMDKTESWQAVLPDGSIVRYREITYMAGSATSNGEDYWDPYKLRIDQTPEHLVAGATWAEQYNETKIDKNGVATTAARNDGWMVVAVDVPCGPVRGQMLSCIELSKGKDGADTGKTYWFAPCVGKVREQGTSVEELTDYTLKDGTP